MFSRQRIVHYFREHRIVSVITGHIVVMTVLAAALLSGSLGRVHLGVFADFSCPQGDQSYTVADGDTLSGIAANHSTTWQPIAKDSGISNPDLIYAGQTVCIPASASAQIMAHKNLPSGEVGNSNPFPYGQCTYWADERYHQLHGAYVPWTTNANAWQWAARATEFGWHVSSTPTVGSIITLQPGVQGASGWGHVAAVEQVLSNGKVVASNMNWNGTGSYVSDYQFSPGSGVTFINN